MILNDELRNVTISRMKFAILSLWLKLLHEDKVFLEVLSFSGHHPLFIVVNIF